MVLHYRVRTYPNANELETDLNHLATGPWKPHLLCPQGTNGILVIYTADAPATEVAAWDHAAQVAEEANLTHEFRDPREED